MVARAEPVALELKRGRTPREVVAQLLDYGAWAKTLGYQELEQIAQRSSQKTISSIYQETFGDAIPETINSSQNLIIVASELDDSSERIISYISEDFGLSINAVFFAYFLENGSEFLGRAWLRDPVETIERSEARKRAPWSGFWFVNVGESEHRNWDDNRNYGFVSAGQGVKYSRPLRHLQPGDKLFAYMKGIGYVGYGEVTHPATPISEFIVGEIGKPLLELPLKAPYAAENKDSHDKSEWVVGVEWVRHFPREEARTFKGVFANPNIVCKLRDQKTLDFLCSEFGVE